MTQNQDPSQLPSLSSGGAETPATPRSHALRIVIYLVVILLVGAAVWRVYSQRKAAQQQSASQAAALLSRPAPVQIAPAEVKPMPIFLTALGTVTPYMTVTVKARVSGQLLPVHFTEGQEVRAGQTILTIDPKPYQAALDQAKGTLAHDQALLKNAQAEANRYNALYAAGVTSKETMETNQATAGQYQGAIEADQAAVENARLQLSWCSIQAPISGKIGLRLVDPGNIITANTTNLVIINQIQPTAVYFTLPEDQLPQVQAKLRAEQQLTVEAWDRDDTQRIATGRLLTTDNQIDTTTGTAKLKAVFDNKDETLFPNQFVNVHLRMEDRPNAIVVPSASIQSGLQGNFVWTITKDDKGADVARMQQVKVALTEGQLAILDSGPAAGDRIVVDGADRLRPGQPVVVSVARQRGAHGSAQTGGQAGNAASSPIGAQPSAAPRPSTGRGGPHKEQK
ncbi:MAG: MdtA/MuxA family multidrug efflux RND transporter periplasmic adaptor subunit [Terracidiphilus sp.]|nr:MdtA/MuxA family multidrug efflux RND transporter periplasmic adaptor subunit [Terracidiphilus sp.]